MNGLIAKILIILVGGILLWLQGILLKSGVVLKPIQIWAIPTVLVILVFVQILIRIKFK